MGIENYPATCKVRPPFFFNTGVVDSSGMRFYYSSIPREHDAGILTVGHHITPFMIIPPGAPKYTIGAVCPANCTESVCHYNYLKLHHFDIWLECPTLHIIITSEQKNSMNVYGDVGMAQA